MTHFLESTIEYLEKELKKPINKIQLKTFSKPKQKPILKDISAKVEVAKKNEEIKQPQTGNIKVKQKEFKTIKTSEKAITWL